MLLFNEWMVFFLSQLGQYRSVGAMAKDIELLVKNAKTYNEPGSQVFKVRALTMMMMMMMSR